MFFFFPGFRVAFLLRKGLPKAREVVYFVFSIHIWDTYVEFMHFPRIFALSERYRRELGVERHVLIPISTSISVTLIAHPVYKHVCIYIFWSYINKYSPRNIISEDLAKQYAPLSKVIKKKDKKLPERNTEHSRPTSQNDLPFSIFN